MSDAYDYERDDKAMLERLTGRSDAARSMIMTVRDALEESGAGNYWKLGVPEHGSDATARFALDGQNGEKLTIIVADDTKQGAPR